MSGMVVKTGGSTMSFDALTIAGILVAILSGGFLLGVAVYNDRKDREDNAESCGGESVSAGHQA
jgi:hypothetical protein